MCLNQRAEAAGLLARAVDIAVESMTAPTQQIQRGEREIRRVIAKPKPRRGRR